MIKKVLKGKQDFKKIFIFIFYKHACFACMYAIYLLVFLKGRRKPKMFCKWVQTMVSCHVDAGNQTLCESSQYPSPLILLFLIMGT